MKRALLAAMLSAAAVGVAATPEGSAAAALEQLRRLSGEWKSSYAWTGARTDSGAMDATYSVTGNGSAVVETLISGGTPSMTTVYHLDGADLRMTHYCGAQNQPRLKAKRIDLAKGLLAFSFVDATNLKSPDAPHVHGFELEFVDAGHIVLTFLFDAAGKHSRERIELARTTGSAPAKS